MRGDWKNWKTLNRCASISAPAGGWTDEEVVMAAHYGILPVTLGPHILRAETACISACAKLL
ncbi:MAG: RsmE family RNA methyltransferase [Elusimicrobiaceae bacterium]|nr:RsmE family RNA methyltransferase [Elusimicrobiaceae bacterium]